MLISKANNLLQLTFLSILTTLMLLTGLTLQAQAQKLAVVDMQKIINDSIIGKAAKYNLESEVKKREGSLAKLKTEVATLRTELEKQSSVLSGSALEEKRSQLEKGEREFARQLQDQREELGKKNRTEISRVVVEIQKVVKELSEEQGYDIVLEKDDRGLLYASNKFDITARVVERLDQKKIDG